jgi:hypothetical protein
MGYIYPAANNRQDMIDSRDVIKRIEELELDRQVLVDDLGDAVDKADDWKESKEALEDWDEGADAEELAVLRRLAEEAQSCTSEWEDGTTLIRDTYFEDFAEEEARSMGLLDGGAMDDWPTRHIDWPAAAAELQQDYSIIEFDGVDYWVRST